MIGHDLCLILRDRSVIGQDLCLFLRYRSVIGLDLCLVLRDRLSLVKIFAWFLEIGL